MSSEGEKRSFVEKVSVARERKKGGNEGGEEESSVYHPPPEKGGGGIFQTENNRSYLRRKGLADWRGKGKKGGN